MGEYVRLEVADGVGTIRLDRPKMNAISIQVQDELRVVAEEAAERATNEYERRVAGFFDRSL